MKRLIVVGMIFSALLHGARAEEGKFTSTISPADLAATGLAGLTPAQLARLNALIEDYKSGALTTARRAADAALAAQQAAEAQAARSEAMAAAARADAAKAEAARAAAVNAEAAKPAPAGGVFAKAKSLLKPSAKTAEAVAVESSVSGKFRGWEAHQVLTLANGQRYQVSDNQGYYCPAVENPKVLILPASMAGYWLRFPDLDVQVRVALLEDR